jgi:hypothetical protein
MTRAVTLISLLVGSVRYFVSPPLDLMTAIFRLVTIPLDLVTTSSSLVTIPLDLGDCFCWSHG